MLLDVNAYLGHFAFRHIGHRSKTPKLPPAMYQSSDSDETLPVKH